MPDTKITKLTRNNVAALRETLGADQAARVDLTATSATFHMSPSDAHALVVAAKVAAAEQHGSTGHPVASLNAVIRKLDALRVSEPDTTSDEAEEVSLTFVVHDDGSGTLTSSNGGRVEYDPVFVQPETIETEPATNETEPGRLSPAGGDVQPWELDPADLAGDGKFRGGSDPESLTHDNRIRAASGLRALRASESPADNIDQALADVVVGLLHLGDLLGADRDWLSDAVEHHRKEITGDY